MYWLSTKSPKVLDTPVDADIAAHLINNNGVDPGMLAKDLKISEIMVKTFQRRLGLRPLSSSVGSPYSD